MEGKIIEILFKGGNLALFAFLVYIIVEIKRKLDKITEKLSDDIKELDKEKLSIEEFYRMFSGWREEIHELHRKIDNLKDAMLKELLR